MAVAFPHVVVHAVSRGSGAGEKPAVYAQLELPEAHGDGDEEPECTHLRLVPADEAARACAGSFRAAGGNTLTPSSQLTQ